LNNYNKIHFRYKHSKTQNIKHEITCAFINAKRMQKDNLYNNCETILYNQNYYYLHLIF